MTHLYELSNQMVGLQRLMEEDDLDPQVLEDTLDGLKGDIQVKAEGLLAYVGNLGSDVDAIDAAIKRLQGRKKTLVNKQDSLRDYLRHNMESADIQKITCPLFTITLRKPSMVVDAPDIRKVPKEYRITTTNTVPDKFAIKAAFKKGEYVPGCKLVPGKSGLLIK